jgi:multidrug efflux system membrane fusion protein
LNVHRPVRSAAPAAIRRALVVLALAAASAACSKTAGAPPAFERPPAPVQVATASARDVPVYLDEIGRVVAKEVVWIQAQVSARIESTNFEDGADLKKGDLLFTLDARPFQARLAAAEATLLRAQSAVIRAQATALRPKATLAHDQAALEYARVEFARAEGLVKTEAISKADYDAKKNAVAMAEADVKQAEAEVAQAAPEEKQALADVAKAEADVATARLDVEYCTVRSPIDGRAGHRFVDAGNLVKENESKLVMVERLDPVYVDFTVNENDVAAIQRNMAKGALRVEARLPDSKDVRAGELTFLDNAVQETTGTLKLRATIPNADHVFWPGRFVNVRLVLEQLAGAVLVPAGTPQLSGKGTFAYVVKDDGTAEMRLVTVGQRQGDLVVLTDGVKAGERVVIMGQLAVTPGGKVRIEEPAAAAAAGAASGQKK